VRGQISLQKTPVEVSELIQHAVEMSRPLIRSRRHRLHLQLPPGPVMFEGDLIRLAQVLANLLNNAAKYTEEGGEIWLNASIEAREVLFRVRDTGPGIAPELLPQVFELFTQAERPLDRSQGGLGIGLTLVKLIVQMHGGGVEARNFEPGKGAEFVVRLPFDAGTDDGGAAREYSYRVTPAVSDAARGHEGAMKILVVDDNVDAADSIALLLNIDGFEARSVHSAAAALDIAASYKPDVVLLDIGLPIMDGYEVARRLRALNSVKPMRIVALSGYGQPADRERARSAGFDEYLVKPVEPATLTDFLRSLEA
jgi:CheY-like chemotaxis protein